MPSCQTNRPLGRSWDWCLPLCAVILVEQVVPSIKWPSHRCIYTVHPHTHTHLLCKWSSAKLSTPSLTLQLSNSLLLRLFKSRLVLLLVTLSLLFCIDFLIMSHQDSVHQLIRNIITLTTAANIKRILMELQWICFLLCRDGWPVRLFCGCTWTPLL